MLCYYTPPLGKMQEFFWPAPAKTCPAGKEHAKKGAHIPCAPPVLQKHTIGKQPAKPGGGQRPIHPKADPQQLRHPSARSPIRRRAAA